MHTLIVELFILKEYRHRSCSLKVKKVGVIDVRFGEVVPNGRIELPFLPNLFFEAQFRDLIGAIRDVSLNRHRVLLLLNKANDGIVCS